MDGPVRRDLHGARIPGQYPSAPVHLPKVYN